MKLLLTLALLFVSSYVFKVVYKLCFNDIYIHTVFLFSDMPVSLTFRSNSFCWMIPTCCKANNAQNTDIALFQPILPLLTDKRGISFSWGCGWKELLNILLSVCFASPASSSISTLSHCWALQGELHEIQAPESLCCIVWSTSCYNRSSLWHNAVNHYFVALL